MRGYFPRLYAMAAMLAATVLCGAEASAGTAPPWSSGWYIGVGPGINEVSGVRQAGRNRDTTCYPDHDCTRLERKAPAGYRWHYDLDSSVGSAFELSFGRAFGAWRLELALDQRRVAVEQRFAGSTYLDGSHIVFRENNSYRSRTRAGVGDLTTRTLALNSYRDFTLTNTRFTPYLGAGVGVSLVKLSDVFFETRYSCRNPAASDCAMPGNYDRGQDTEFSDSVFSAHLHAGLDYRVSDRVRIGLKLTYSMVDDFEATRGYAFYPIADLTNTTVISGMDHISAMLTLKYFLGD